MWSEISTLLLKNETLNTIMMRFLDGFPYIALSHLCVWDSDSLANIVTLSQTHTVRLFPLMGLPVSVVRRWSTSTNWPLAVKGSTRPSSYFVFPLECWFCKVNGLLTDSGFHFTVVATEKQGLKDLCFSCSIILEQQQNQRSIGKKNTVDINFCCGLLTRHVDFHFSLDSKKSLIMSQLPELFAL